MKKLIKKIKATFNKKVISLKTAVISARNTLAAQSGEGYIDTGVKIIVGVVIGGIILAGLYALFNSTIIPTMTSKISDMFNYAG